MKRYRCPECGTEAPARLYADEAARGTLRCFQCSLPGHPVYIEVVDDTPAPKKAKKVSA